MNFAYSFIIFCAELILLFHFLVFLIALSDDRYDIINSRTGYSLRHSVRNGILCSPGVTQRQLLICYLLLNIMLPKNTTFGLRRAIHSICSQTRFVAHEPSFAIYGGVNLTPPKKGIEERCVNRTLD